jgi:hypothetical protein
VHHNDFDDFNNDLDLDDHDNSRSDSQFRPR